MVDDTDYTYCIKNPAYRFRIVQVIQHSSGKSFFFESARFFHSYAALHVVFHSYAAPFFIVTLNDQRPFEQWL